MGVQNLVFVAWAVVQAFVVVEEVVLPVGLDDSIFYSKRIPLCFFLEECSC